MAEKKTPKPQSLRGFDKRSLTVDKIPVRDRVEARKQTAKETN